MKHVLILTFMLIATMGMSQASTAAGESLTFTDKGSGIVISQNETDKEFLGYTVYATNSGSEFILNKKKNGSGTYKMWIGASTAHTHEGKEVRQFKSGTYAYFTKEGDGRVKKHGLEAN